MEKNKSSDENPLIEIIGYRLWVNEKFFCYTELVRHHITFYSRQMLLASVLTQNLQMFEGDVLKIDFNYKIIN